jgi:hypothetical protein
VSYTVTTGPVSFRLLQGVAATPGGRFRTAYQFPTTVSMGLEDEAGWALSASVTHYSNGQAQSGPSYNGIGLALGKRF